MRNLLSIILTGVIFFCCFALPVLVFADATPASGSFTNPLTATSFEGLLTDIIAWIRNIALMIAVGVILYAGLLFMSSGGNEQKVERAKKAFIYALVGLAIVIIGEGFINLIEDILGAS